MKSLLIIPFTVFSLFLLAKNQPSTIGPYPEDKPIRMSSRESAVDTCLNLDLGPDANVCLGAVFTLNENPIPGTYSWFGSNGLSCTDCPSPKFTATGTGIFILGCIVTTPFCSDTDFIRINVSPGLQPTLFISPDTSICVGSSVALGGLSAPGHLYTWTSKPPGFTSTISAPLPVTPGATTTYFIKVTSPACTFPRYDSVVVRVFQPPVLSLISGASICLGDSISLGNTQVQTGVTYTWSPNNGTLSSITDPNPVAKPLVAGLNAYTVKASNPGCSVTGLVSVIAVNLQLSLSIGDTTTICKGSSQEVMVSVLPLNTNIAWSPIQNLQLSPDGLTGIVSPSTNATYTITATAPGCMRSHDIFIQVDSLPQNLGISPMDTSICAEKLVNLVPSSLVDLLNFPGIMFSWTPANGQLSPLNLPALSVKPLDSIVYQRITVNGVCRDTVYARVNVIKPPAITIAPANSSICLGKSVVLTATAPGIDNLAWTPATGLSCSNCLMPTAMPTTSTQFTLSGLYKGCPVSQEAHVEVMSPPTYQFPPAGPRCSGEQLQLNLITDPNATTYTWTSNPPSVIPQVAQPTVTLSGQGQQNITYYLQASNGSCSVRDSFKIQVNGVALMASAPDTICPQTTRLLTASASIGGGQYSWSNGAMTQATNVTPLQTTTYTVTYSLNGCAFQDSVQIVVQGQTPVIQFPNDFALCPGDTILLNSVVTPGATYSWSSNVGGFSSMVAIPPAQAPTQSTKYTVTATGLDGCSVTKSLDVTVFQATLSVSGDMMVCAGEPFTVSGTGSATGSYLWMPGAITTPSFTKTLNSEQTINYAVLYTYGTMGNECYLQDTVNVKILRNFAVNIVSDPDSVLNLGDALMLDAIVAPSQNLNGFTFNWFEGNTNVGHTEQLSITPQTTETSIQYSVVVVSPNGCSQTQIIQFRVVQPVVEYPNAFTPNGDGANDLFRLAVVEGKVTVEQFEIYNRWGAKVYESNDPDASWDGRINTNIAPSDVYVYKIHWRRGDGSLVVHNGEVTLLR